MADDKVPTADQAVEQIVSELKKMRKDSATVAAQQGYLKSQLLSNKVVLPQHRTEVLKKVNHAIGTTWSMTKVKGADHTPYVVKDTTKKQPIPVEELHGSSTVDMAASPDKGVTVKVIPEDQMPEETDGVKAETIIGGARSSVIAAVAQEAMTTSDAEEVQQPSATTSAPEQMQSTQSEATAQTNTSQSEDINMQNNTQQANTEQTTAGADAAKEAAAMNDFLNLMALRGAATTDMRLEAFQYYLDHKSPETKPVFEVFAASQPADTTTDQRIFAFLSEEHNKAFAQAFTLWMISEYVPVAGTSSAAEAKARWSLTGERDEGIRSSWIAAGGAVIGGGMEMAACGGLTMGSGIGTLAGAVGAFFVGEMVDDNIESQFGRYVLAGTIGLGLGAAGASLGRNLLPGKVLVGTTFDGEAPVQIEVPTNSLAMLGGL